MYDKRFTILLHVSHIDVIDYLHVRLIMRKSWFGETPKTNDYKFLYP